MQYLPEPILVFLQASSTGSIEQYTVRSSARYLSLHFHFHFTRANTAHCGYWMGFTNRNSMHMLCPMQCGIVPTEYPQYSENIPAYTQDCPIMKYFDSICNEISMPELCSFKPWFSWQLRMILNYEGKAKYVHKCLQDQFSKQWLIAEALGIQAQDDSRGIKSIKQHRNGHWKTMQPCEQEESILEHKKEKKKHVHNISKTSYTKWNYEVGNRKIEKTVIGIPG